MLQPSTLFDNPSEWTVIRYCVDISPETSLAISIAITLQHQTGEERTLVFDEPRFSDFGPFQVPQIQHIQIRDTSDKGWEQSVKLEICELFEDEATLFWASSVQVNTRQ
ncbi:hypothetical protein [Massilia sp. NR 4-1]|uniref:hypothetical protein n=1 Tax=Massilia sp. NR 4-1 TaxID=1678028 RepID=UPI00067AFE7B|nr:hypothetical protein [Massilia sp. NR 4-1]AKU22564.1 hypothetical protein ACZ75_14855 [Massilia sp. NR 4-1]